MGVELVQDPSIIFLDEPTTGLDSEMALGVMLALKGMAKAGKMVRLTLLSFTPSPVVDVQTKWCCMLMHQDDFPTWWLQAPAVNTSNCDCVGNRQYCEVGIDMLLV